MTDAGVFSKTGVDFGSQVLIEAMELADECTGAGCWLRLWADRDYSCEAWLSEGM